MSRARAAVRSLKGPEVATRAASRNVEHVSVASVHETERFRLREDLGAIDELAHDIDRNGLLYHLIVRPSANGYELIAGYRRFSAIKKLGWSEVPVEVRDLDDAAALRLAIAENEQRKTLTENERLRVVAQIDDAGRAAGKKVDDIVGEIADVFGWKERNAHNYLRVATKAPPVVRDAVRKGDLGFSTALDLVSAELAEGVTLEDVIPILSTVPVRQARDVLRVAGATELLLAAYRDGEVSLPAATEALDAVKTRRVDWSQLVPKLRGRTVEDVPDVVKAVLTKKREDDDDKKRRESFQAFRWDERVPEEKGFTLHVNFRVDRVKTDAETVIAALEDALARVRKLRKVGAAKPARGRRR